MKFIMGVDPGVTGALAILDPKEMSILEVHATPAMKTTKTKRTIDYFRLADFFDRWAKNCRFMVIEDVHSMPNQGVASMFSFGKSYGVMLGMAAAYNLPMFQIRPEIWKGVMNLGRDKKAAIKRAKELYFFDELSDGMAEAILIAHFGKRFWGSENS